MTANRGQEGDVMIDYVRKALNHASEEIQAAMLECTEYEKEFVAPVPPPSKPVERAKHIRERTDNGKYAGVKTLMIMNVRKRNLQNQLRHLQALDALYESIKK